MTYGIDGTYAYVYGGQKGLGAGIAVIEGESFRATDTGGWVSAGRIVKSDGAVGSFDLVGQHVIPPGSWGVGGSSPRDLKTKQDFVGRLPADFATGVAFPWATPSGPCTAMAYPIDNANMDFFSEQLSRLLGKP